MEGLAMEQDTELAYAWSIWRRCENVLQKLKNEAAIDVDNIGSDYHMGRCEALGDALDAITAESYRTIAFDCAALSPIDGSVDPIVIRE